MRCPQCGSTAKQAVLETRAGKDGSISRRRRCEDCRHVFRTSEQLSGDGVQVRKVDGRVVPFVRDSIRTNIKKAAAQRLHADRVDELTDVVVADVYPLARDGPIPTTAIAEAVLGRLHQVDPATHIRFALAHLGRRGGWNDVDEVRAWLHHEYPSVRAEPLPRMLTSVVKRDGRIVTFDRKRLEAAIDISSKGRGTPAEVRQLANDVADDVMRALGDQPVVTSGQLAAEILNSLRGRDDVAYLRFASTVKRFSSPGQYEAEALALGRARGTTQSAG